MDSNQKAFDRRFTNAKSSTVAIWKAYCYENSLRSIYLLTHGTRSTTTNDEQSTLLCACETHNHNKCVFVSLFLREATCSAGRDLINSIT